MDKELNDLLNFDPLDTAEKITGVSYKKDDGTVASGFLLMMENSRRKAQILQAYGDTVFNNALSDYQRIISQEGFEKALELDFAGDCAGERYAEKLFIYWKASEGLLLRFDTFGGKSVNGSNVYFNIQLRPDYQRSGIPGYSGRVNEKHLLSAYIDGREALRHHLASYRTQGKFLPVWEEPPFLYLLHYGDSKDKDYDYKKITRERIATLPKQVRDAIKE